MNFGFPASKLMLLFFSVVLFGLFYTTWLSLDEFAQRTIVTVEPPKSYQVKNLMIIVIYLTNQFPGSLCSWVKTGFIKESNKYRDFVFPVNPKLKHFQEGNEWICDSLWLAKYPRRIFRSYKCKLFTLLKI